MEERGSVWRRWDPHIHLPGGTFNDQFSNLENYLDAISEAQPKVSALGITDYMSIRSYERLIHYKDDPRLNEIWIFPNIEFRLTPWTDRRHAINLHLLISTDDKHHVAETKRELGRLFFPYQGTEYSCTEEDLIRLGEAYSKGADTGEAAYKTGALQFKPSFQDFSTWYKKSSWLRHNSVVAVDGGTDGPSGIQKDGGYGATREEIFGFAEIIFSGNPRDRSFWIGQGSESIEEIVQQYRNLKPCLHGSDAHRDEEILQPDENRYCWIKADTCFTGLLQIIYEPDARVFIGEEAPEDKLSSYVVDHVGLQSPWIEQEQIPLNSGLVSVIGEKGSGKTALADLVAYPLGMDVEERGFLKRAWDAHAGNTMNVRMGDGTLASRLFPDEFSDIPSVKYLPQQFVDDLCGEVEISEKLVREIERVIFNNIQPEERLGASDFEKLRELKTSGLVDERSRLRGLIATINSRIAKIDSDRQSLGRKQLELKSKNQEIEKAKANLVLIQRKITSDEDRKALAQLEELEKSRKRLSNQIDQINRSLQLLIDAERASTTLSERVDSDVEEIRAAIINAGADAKSLATPKIDLTSLEASIKGRRASLENDANLCKKLGDPNLETIDLSIEKINDSLNITKERRKQLTDQQSSLKELVNTRDSLVEEIERINQSAAGRDELIQTREDHYIRYFELLTEEADLLRALHSPLEEILSTGEGQAQKLEFTIQTKVDLASWLAKGDDLFDGRKEGPFRSDPFRLTELVDQHLVGPWNSLDEDKIRPGLSDLLPTIAEAVKTSLKDRTTFQDVADWLYSVDHVSLEYGLKFEGTELSKLSPGTKGIVLLILYLAVDLEDRTPLIIDQPDENLDNRSIHEILGPFFRQAKERRQVIIVTHNPNLVINTDADQVVVATNQKDSNGMPKINYFWGGLESQTRCSINGWTIREAVCALLEGGREAFEQRDRKYNLTRIYTD